MKIFESIDLNLIVKQQQMSDIYDSRNLYCDHFRIHGIILRTLKVKLSKYQSFNNSYICIDMGIYFATYDSQIVYNQQ